MARPGSSEEQSAVSSHSLNHLQFGFQRAGSLEILEDRDDVSRRGADRRQGPHQFLDAGALLEYHVASFFFFGDDRNLAGVTVVCPPESGPGWETFRFVWISTVRPPCRMATGAILTSLPITMVPVRSLITILAGTVRFDRQVFEFAEKLEPSLPL